jgi:L-asparaginase II
MTDPVLVEVTRGNLVESAHRGAVAVFDADGKLIFEAGDIDASVFPRSSVKSMQALPLIESGAADAFGFGDRELALACSSHRGEPEHTALAADMLKRAGFGEGALECGSHWPSNHEATLELARAGGKPNQLHNNCSGKHSGFLAVCRQCGIDNAGYVAAGHPFQEMVRQTMEEVTGAKHKPENSGIDGCSIPTFAIPLRALGQGFARMVSGKGFSPSRARAAKRLVDACMAEPFLVAGTGRADTLLMQAAPGRIFVKGGAEGVHCGVLPELGVGFALKCADGAGRGVEVATAALIRKLLGSGIDLSAVERPVIHSRRGADVGELRPTAVFA